MTSHGRFEKNHEEEAVQRFAIDEAAARRRHDQVRERLAGVSGRKTVGVALGGGLPFGVVSVGVLKVLEEAGIPIDLVAGTSMGAIVGVLYARYADARKVEALFLEFFERHNVKALFLRDLTIPRAGLLSGRTLMRTIEEFLGGDFTFEELQIPCYVNATELARGQEVVFRSGSVLQAIRASISLPGIFIPAEYNGMVLVDGAMTSPVPIHLVEPEVDVVIPVRAVRDRDHVRDLESLRRSHREAFESGFFGKTPSVFSVLWRSLALILQDEFAELVLSNERFAIKPKIPLELGSDFSRIGELVRYGEVAAREKLPELKAMLEAPAEERP
jgi:NTE family protein